MNPDIDALRDAVTILTTSHQVVVDDRDGTYLGTRKEAALLAKLRAASIPNSGSASGGGSMKSRRSALNVSAVDLMWSIETRASTWYREELLKEGLTAPSSSYPGRVEAVLTTWHNLVIRRYKADQIADHGLAARVGAVRRMASEIERLLDPNYTFELDAKCPECGSLFQSAQVAGEWVRQRALLVTECEPLEASYVTCRHCKHTWHGITEARALSFAIDQARRANA
jgi:hypothetical protein